MLGLAACGANVTSAESLSASTSTGGIPDETAGPFPGDGSNGPDVLEQSGIVSSDICSSFGQSAHTAAGVPVVGSSGVGRGAPFGAPGS